MMRLFQAGERERPSEIRAIAYKFSTSSTSGAMMTFIISVLLISLLCVSPLLCSSSTLMSLEGQSNSPPTKVKGGYYTAGTSGLLPSSVINATLFTHLFYAFAKVDPQTSNVVAVGDQVDEMQTFSAKLKSINSDVLTLISISVAGAPFGLVLQSQESQTAFINSSIDLARTFGFDGLDLDWEFAQSQAQMTAFGSFIGEWRQAVIAEAKQTSRSPLLLTAAVYFNATLLYIGSGAYPIPAITQNLDFVNIMCYDFHGSWNVKATGANANLYDPSSVLSADHGITSWLEAGLPPEKAVLGLTLYGRSWTLKNQTAAAGLGAPAVAAGPEQSVSKTPGIFYYSEVANWIVANNATVVHDELEVTGYCYANSVWVSYEDPLIISQKVLYAKARGLRGYFFWEISYDRAWEVSTAASLTMDSAIVPEPPGPAPSPAPVSASLGTASGLPLSPTAVLLLISISLLVFTSSAHVKL